MSMMGSGNYEMYRQVNYKPEWIRSERYEYCDGFYDIFKGKAEGKVRRFFSILLGVEL